MLVTTLLPYFVSNAMSREMLQALLSVFLSYRFIRVVANYYLLLQATR